MDGVVDFETGETSFSGSSWISNPSSLGLSDFAGTVDFGAQTISGLVDNESERVFSLAKTSSSYKPTQIDFEDAARERIGEFEEGIWAMSSGDVSSEAYDSLVMYDVGNHAARGTWSDRWFAFGSSGYNHELATTASILASAA